MANFGEKYMAHLSSHKSRAGHMSPESFQTTPKASAMALSLPAWILSIAFPGAQESYENWLDITKTVCVTFLKTPSKEKHYLIHCADSWRRKESRSSNDCLSWLMVFYHLISQMSKGSWCHIFNWPKLPKWPFFKELFLHLDTLSSSSWRVLMTRREHSSKPLLRKESTGDELLIFDIVSKFSWGYE